jgi:hypothetical protein
MQADAGDEDRRDRHQRQHMPGRRQTRAHQGPLVTAEQTLDPPQGCRVDVPGVAGM